MWHEKKLSKDTQDFLNKVLVNRFQEPNTGKLDYKLLLVLKVSELYIKKYAYLIITL